MTPDQKAFLEKIAEKIPRLLEALEKSDYAAEFSIGKKRVKGRLIELVLRAHVISDESSPLETHSSNVEEKPRPDEGELKRGRGRRNRGKGI